MSPDDAKQNLQEPLLQRSASDLKTHIRAKNSSAGQQVSPHKCVGVGLFGGVLNLCKAVLGAGLLSIPRAFSLLGGLVGTAAFLVVSLLTVFTINLGMIQPSVAHGSSSDGGGGGAHGHGGPDVLALTTYSAAVSYWVGRRAERLLSIMMLVGLLGFSATFLDIIADILVGDEINPGLLTGGVAVLCSCNVFPPTVPGGHHVPSPAGPTNTSLPGPSLLASDYEAMAVGMAAGYANREMGAGPYDDMQGADAGAPMARLAIPQAAQPLLAAGWLQEGFVDVHAPAWATLLCDRRVVLLGVVFGLLLPLAVQRNMGSLSAVNAVGLASLAVLLASLLWLAGSALWQGSAYALPLLPDFEGLGDCGTIQALTAFGIMSVLLTANGCHANMFPLMTIVQPFSARSMQRILGTTIAITTTYYWLLSVTAYLVFGEGIKEDILTNLSPAALAPLVGQWAGMTLAFVLRAGYMVSIMGSAVLTMFPLRQSCIDLLLGSAADPMQRTDSSGHISTCPDGMLVDDDGTGGDQLLATSGPAGESGRSTARHSANGTGIVSSRVTGNGTPAVHQLASAGVETSAGLGELIGAVPGHLPPSPTPEQLTAKDIAIVIKSGDASHHLTSLHHGSPAPAVAADALPAVAAAAAAPADATAAAVAHARWMSVRERRADALHVPLTLGLMSTAYIAAVTVPSIWVVISLVGSVSLTFMCFIMPALIGLHALHKNRHLGRATRLVVRGVLYLVVLLGGLVFINGWVMLAVNIHKAKTQPGPA